MKVLISFASTEGQTRKIAEWMAIRAREQGHEVSLYDTASLISVPDIDAFNLVIVAASVHEQCHQDSVINFATAHRDQLIRRPSAFVSVSLSAATADGQAEAQEYVDRFMATTSWSPTKTLLLGGALRLSECDYFQRQVLKHILMNRGITPVDVNYEFTDWTSLERFIGDILAGASPRAIELTNCD
jgi:menaquinone-dependent protoporphyrinogen oxidase